MRYSEIIEGKSVLDLFQLPTAVVEFYDDPTQGVGDEGWTIDELVDEMQTNGMRQRTPIEVGRSRVDMKYSGDTNVYAFNGNHRLAACKKLGLQFVLCVNSSSYDAVPLTLEDIHTLGGRV